MAVLKVYSMVERRAAPKGLQKVDCLVSNLVVV